MISRIINNIVKFVALIVVCGTLHADTYLHSPDTFLEPDHKNWISLEIEILAAKDKNIYIYWEGIGGLLYIADDFIDVLQRAEAQGKHITFILTGNAYSAHAITACYASNVEFGGYFLMFHPVSTGSGSRERIVTDPQTIQATEDLLQPCVDKGMLTKQDVRESLMLYEVYVYHKGNSYSKIYRLDRRIGNERHN